MMRMPDFSNPDVWMENITQMREGDLLAIDTADDGQPLCSDTLIQNFIRELDDEASFEMMKLLKIGESEEMRISRRHGRSTKKSLSKTKMKTMQNIISFLVSNKPQHTMS